MVTTGHCDHSHVLFHVPTPSFLERHRSMDDKHTPCFSPIHHHHQSSTPFITFSIVCIHRCVHTPSSVFLNRSCNIIHHHNCSAANFQNRSTSKPCCNITIASAMPPWPVLSGLTASILILGFQPESRLHLATFDCTCLIRRLSTPTVGTAQRSDPLVHLCHWDCTCLIRLLSSSTVGTAQRSDPLVLPCHCDMNRRSLMCKTIANFTFRLSCHAHQFPDHTFPFRMNAASAPLSHN